MGNRTDRWCTAKFQAALVCVLGLTSCGWESPQKGYDRAWAAYVRGDLRAAEEEAAKGAARMQSKPEWHWKFRLLRAEAMATADRPKEAAALLAGAIPDEPGLSQLQVRQLIDRADVAPGLEESLELLRQAEARVTDAELAVRIPLTMGTAALEHRRRDLAETALSKAHAMASAFPYRDAMALSNLCYCYKSQARLEKSVEVGLLALSAAERAGAQKLAALARGNLGSTYALLGDFEAAHKYQTEAVRSFEAMGARLPLTRALGELGLLFDLQDVFPQAVANYQRAFQIATELNDARDAVRFAENLSTTLIKSGQWDAAAEWNQRAADLSVAAKFGDAVPFRERNQARIEFGRGNYAEAARISRALLAGGNASASIQWAAHHLLGLIEARQGQAKTAAAEFDTALRIIESTRSDLLNQHYRITLLSRLIPFYREYVDFLIDRDDDAGAMRVLESSRARVLAERLEKETKVERFTDPARVERWGRANHVSLLSFHIAPRRSFAWLIGEAGTRRFALPPAAEVEKLVTDYRALVEHSLWNPLTANKPETAALWNGLIAPIAREIPAGSRLIVIPDGPLHRLNLETLVATTPQPHYWIEDVQMAVAPSLALAMSNTSNAAAAARGSALLMGAADYTGTSYQPLKGAEREIRDIQERLATISPAVYTGREATPRAYRDANPGRFAFIHFAAHAEANAEKPLESAVVLSRAADAYKLYARDVIGIPIRADLVTLSACHSAGSRAYAGEGLIGFAWAFLNAGARAVVAGLWDASDESTAPLMDRFYAEMATGKAPVEALRLAKLHLLRNDARFGKPFYWGAFQVYLGSAGTIR